jgi:hypothetical protein
MWDAVASMWEMACPGCASGEYLDVQAKVFVRLVEDGTDIDGSGNHDHEWDGDSICQCCSCGWSGLVEDAQKFFVDNTDKEDRPGEGIEPGREESGGQEDGGNQI